MVDLVDGVDKMDAGKVDTVDARLRGLLAYDAEMPVFSEAEIETLIEDSQGIRGGT